MVDGRAVQGFILFAKPGFHVAETATEFGIGAAEGLLRIDLQEAGEVDDGEEKVADLVLPLPVVVGLADFGDFFVNFVNYLFRIGPIEAGAGGAGTDLLGFDERGQGSRHSIEQALRLVGFARAFGGFDFVPTFENGVAGGDFFFTKNVRVAADEFFVDGVEAVVDFKVTCFGRHLGVKNGLEEEVAQFARQLVPCPPVNGVEDLVGFFERVWLDGIEGLFSVPRTAVGST